MVAVVAKPAETAVVAVYAMAAVTYRQRITPRTAYVPKVNVC